MDRVVILNNWSETESDFFKLFYLIACHPCVRAAQQLQKINKSFIFLIFEYTWINLAFSFHLDAPHTAQAQYLVSLTTFSLLKSLLCTVYLL
jgi:hypothetical protein